MTAVAWCKPELCSVSNDREGNISADEAQGDSRSVAICDEIVIRCSCYEGIAMKESDFSGLVGFRVVR